LRFVEVVNEDGEKVTTKVTHKELFYMPLTPWMKWLFLSKKTARHMRWHKEGVYENDQVMVHPSDCEVWKALNDFDADFARDAWNVRIGLAMDGWVVSLIIDVFCPWITHVGWTATHSRRAILS
jgi:hypothetical protein